MNCGSGGGVVGWETFVFAPLPPPPPALIRRALSPRTGDREGSCDAPWPPEAATPTVCADDVPLPPLPPLPLPMCTSAAVGVIVEDRRQALAQGRLRRFDAVGGVGVGAAALPTGVCCAGISGDADLEDVAVVGAVVVVVVAPSVERAPVAIAPFAFVFVVFAPSAAAAAVATAPFAATGDAKTTRENAPTPSVFSMRYRPTRPDASSSDSSATVGSSAATEAVASTAGSTATVGGAAAAAATFAAVDARFAAGSRGWVAMTGGGWRWGAAAAAALFALLLLLLPAPRTMGARLLPVAFSLGPWTCLDTPALPRESNGGGGPRPILAGLAELPGANASSRTGDGGRRGGDVGGGASGRVASASGRAMGRAVSSAAAAALGSVGKRLGRWYESGSNGMLAAVAGDASRDASRGHGERVGLVAAVVAAAAPAATLGIDGRWWWWCAEPFDWLLQLRVCEDDEDEGVGDDDDGCGCG